MDDVNYHVLFAFGTTILFVLVIIFYIIPLQIREVLKAERWIKRLSYLLLALFALSAFSIIPTLAYQYMRSKGLESQALRNIAGDTGSISRLAIIVVLVLIYNFQRKE